MMMELFNDKTVINILPYDGAADYYGKVMEAAEAAHYYDTLMQTIEWRNDEAVIFGRRIITKRKVAWYGNSNYSYTYSKVTRNAIAWTKELLELKQLSESLTGAKFNSCLLNLYHNGDEGVAWHSDDEKTLERNGAIASLSFGAARKFSFRHKKTKETTSVLLESGSLLVMRDITQEAWLHSLPKSKKVLTPRINLTFRSMVIGD